ncbi:D-hydantoinase [Jeotgalicoccus saudimassiliensis]|uniref:D-hydantoinase n=1 Tax=Jeotgalicoccus saudimassiliensis TaxID=1461582 RepID=A0A078M2B5_9STAP|nr:dihydropyrimidinase [Jeotgalicoccus saudimassiliensis]CDZ98981.1 D-hydantoinase [Jeotgalicoccus saudimassiliensis]
MSTLIKNGIIVTTDNEYKGDVFIDGTKIEAVGRHLTMEADKVIDAEGMYILPGGIDQHAHFSFEFMGERTKGFETTDAAALGGTTTVIEFVNQEEGKGLVETVEAYRKEWAEGISMVDYSFHPVITDPTPETFKDIKNLPAAGYPTVKLFMAYKGQFFHSDDEAVTNALLEAKDAGVTVMVHAENADLIDLMQKKAIANGETDPYHHALTRPPIVETEATERAINLARFAEAPIYIVHVTTEGAVNAIKKAKEEGLPVYGETCTQYLLFDKEYLAKEDFEGSKYVCSPALRDKKDQEYLWKSLKDGSINAVSSDHCGFTFEQKKMGLDDFRLIPNGTPGLENRLPMLWTYGVEAGRITRSELVDYYSTMPAKNNGLDHRKGYIAPGYDADVVIYNPMVEKKVTVEDSLNALDYTVYEGFDQIGECDAVFLRGTQVVKDGKYVGEKGQGAFIKGTAFGTAFR